MLSHQAYRLLRAVGLNYTRLLVPYYWVPYNFGGGRALPPFHAALELTFRCNLRCRMCSLVASNAVVDGGTPRNRIGAGGDPQSLRGKELSLEEYSRLLGDLKSCGVRHVGFTGGEPFIRSDAPALLREAGRRGLLLSAITNGTVMSDELCDALVVSGLRSLTISLDGPEAIHNRIRGSTSAFSRLRRNVLKLREWKEQAGARLPKIGFSCVVSACNQDHLSEVVAVAKDCGVSELVFGFLFFTDDATRIATERLTPTGQADFADQRIPEDLRRVDAVGLERELGAARRRAAELGVRISVMPPLQGGELWQRFHAPSQFYANKCFVPWYQVRINPYGDVYPCQIDTRMGNVREASLRAIWNGKDYRRFRELVREQGLLPGCSRCCKLNDRTWSYLPRIRLPWLRGGRRPAAFRDTDPAAVHGRPSSRSSARS